MGRKPVDIDVERLRRLYLGEGKSMVEIARMFGTSRETIRNRLHSEGIPVRPRSYPGSSKRFRVGR